MALLQFVNSFLLKQKGTKEYQEMVNQYLSDGVLSDEEKAKLKQLQEEFGLSDENVKKLHEIGVSAYFKQVSSDERITDDEKESLEVIMTHFGLEQKDIDFDQASFNKFYSLALIDRGVLPTVADGNHNLNLIFKAGEILHYGQNATLRRLKNVTTRVNYSGLTGSVKIMRGLRYRVGSIKVGRETNEIYAPEDTGGFYLTNQRIGFLGTRKQFSIPYQKIGSFELGPGGLRIFKDGKETPYIVTLDDYEVPLAVISYILNKE